MLLTRFCSNKGRLQVLPRQCYDSLRTGLANEKCAAQQGHPGKPVYEWGILDELKTRGQLYRHKERLPDAPLEAYQIGLAVGIAGAVQVAGKEIKVWTFTQHSRISKGRSGWNPSAGGRR